jgi:hypothetical protein
MATYYWVGGSGAWNQTATRNWAATSGGPGNAGAPTSADDVVFDAASDVAAPFTVTVGTGAVCNSFSTGGAGGALDQVMTLAGTGTLAIYGSLTFPVTNLTRTFTGQLQFLSTTTGNTITTNGVATASITVFNGVGGAWTLGSAWTNTGASINVQAGTFNTGNFAVTAATLNVTGTEVRAVNLGSSTVTLTGANALAATTITNLTFSAGTSTVAFSDPNAILSGVGLTYNNVSFTSTANGNLSIRSSNTFNNLTFAGKTVTALAGIILTSGTTQTVTGTLTFSPSTSAISRTWVRASIFRIQATINVAAVAAIQDVDFRDIVITGAAAPISGTRLSNGQNNSGITFAAGVNKYWSLAAGGNWASTAWALTSGGVPAVDNYPLGQDTVIVEDTGLNSGATITFNLSSLVGNFTTATRTLPATIALGALGPGFYGNVTLSSAITMTGTTGAFAIAGYGITQTITSAGVTWPKSINVAPINSTVVFADAFNVTGTVTFGVTTGAGSCTCNFKDGTTNTATTFAILFSTIQSSVPGSQFTLSQTSGYVVANSSTIKDCNATGGAVWTAPLYYGNVDSGNNTGWAFSNYPSINRGLTPVLRFGFKI